MKTDLLSFTISFLMHMAVITGADRTFVKPVDYGVESGSGGIEINLIAAPNTAAQASEVTFLEPGALHQHSVEENKIPENLQGDGSSSIPGKNKITLSSMSGAITEAKAGYLKNPAPSYPDEARKKGWYGIVILKVLVDKAGSPTQIEKEQSSGFSILDESAQTAVRKWKFMPAQIGNIPIQSTVRIPVKFKLEA